MKGIIVGIHISITFQNESKNTHSGPLRYSATRLNYVKTSLLLYRCTDTNHHIAKYSRPSAFVIMFWFILIIIPEPNTLLYLYFSNFLG